MTSSDTKRYDVVVVGGGQAGLAIGYFLAQRGRGFRILEAAPEPAAAWRQRWDSLELFTPARYNALPAPGFPGDPDRYPGPRRGGRVLTRLRPSLRPAGRAEHFPGSTPGARRCSAGSRTTPSTSPTRSTRSTRRPRVASSGPRSASHRRTR